MEARVKTGIWVSAALRLSGATGNPGAVLRRGDPDSGGIIVVLRGRAGLTALSQTRTQDGEPAWLRGTGKDPVDDATIDAYIARATARDPDVWVVEFESPNMLPPFEGTIL